MIVLIYTTIHFFVLKEYQRTLKKRKVYLNSCRCYADPGSGFIESKELEAQRLNIRFIEHRASKVIIGKDLN